jgi:hypothetical protein
MRFLRNYTASVRFGEIGRLAHRAIAGDEFDVPVFGLAELAFGVAIRALENASRSPAVAAHVPAS